MNYMELDTPALLIDREIMTDNIRRMQDHADSWNVALRPHTKTHKMPELAKLQLEAGSKGIAVAKTGEAEVMARHGVRDIFIANEIVGDEKLERIATLQKDSLEISFGIDAPEHVRAAERIFGGAGLTAQVLIEIEVGENRSGIIEEADFLILLEEIRTSPHVHLKGLFSHDGNSYDAATREECLAIARGAQERTLRFAALAREKGFPCEVVSYGSTPPLINEAKILEGITEIRPGTYILMDASMAATVGTLDHCAAKVLATVISKPTPERVILDVGAKGLTMQERRDGISATPGKGTLADYPGVFIDAVYDEHAIIYNRGFHDAVAIGDKVRIIPVHICPVCNLYGSAWLVSGEEVVREIPVAGRGMLL